MAIIQFSSVMAEEVSMVSTPGPGFRHRGPVTCVAAIPRARKAVTSGYDGAVGMFDLDTGESSLIGYHRHLVNRIIVNQTGTKAASSSSDYTICIWDLLTLKPEMVLQGHSDDVEDFAFVDDHTGVSASRDQRVIIWNLDTGAITRIIHEHEKDVLSVVYADGKIYSSGDDKTLRQWDLRSGALMRVWGPFDQETDTCAIDPLHQRVVLGCDDGAIRVFDSQTGSLIQTIAAHASGIKKVAVSPASGDILSAAYDQRVLIWDADNFTLKVELERLPIIWERSLNWSPDGASILAGTFDGTVVEWAAASGKRLRESGLQGQEKGNACFNDISASRDGTLVLVSDDGYVRLAHLTEAAAVWLQQTEPVSGRMLMNAVTVDDKYDIAVTGAHNHTLHIFEKANTGLRHAMEVPLREGPINCLRIAHHTEFAGEIFAACYSGAIVRVSTSGEIKGRIRVHEGAVKSLRIHPDKPLGVSCGADNRLVCWELGGRLLESFTGHTAIIDDVDLDPTGEFIASVSRDFTLKIYQLSSGKLLHSIALGHKSPKSVCYLTPTIVVVGEYWGALLKVNIENATVTRKQIAHNGISSLSRSGSHLVASSYDGAVYLIDPEDVTVIRTLRAMNQRLEGAVTVGG